MRYSALTTIGILAMLLAGASPLAGCASDPRYQQGLKWFLENEAQKAELERMGFPQYADD